MTQRMPKRSLCPICGKPAEDATRRVAALTRVAHSRGAAIEAQYAETIDLAWRSLRRLGVADAALADAVQDTLLVVHRRSAEFRGEASFRTWVYGIVLRVASGYRRSAGRAGAVFDRQPLEADAAPSAAPSPFEHLEQRAATELLHRLLDELSSDVRDVFVLVELEAVDQVLARPLANPDAGDRRLATARAPGERAGCRRGHGERDPILGPVRLVSL